MSNTYEKFMNIYLHPTDFRKSYFMIDEKRHRFIPDLIETHYEISLQLKQEDVIPDMAYFAEVFSLECVLGKMISTYYNCLLTKGIRQVWNI